jgi:hypothetical protein
MTRRQKTPNWKFFTLGPRPGTYRSTITQPEGLYLLPPRLLLLWWDGIATAHHTYNDDYDVAANNFMAIFVTLGLSVENGVGGTFSMRQLQCVSFLMVVW